MLFRKSILSMIALFMSVSGMPVYAEQAPEPEVMETDKKLVPETGIASTLGVKKLEAEEPGTLIAGQDFNKVIRSLTGGDTTWDTDDLIQAIQVVDALPSENITMKDVSAKQDGSYLAWWNADTKTIYLYSKSGKIVLNPDSHYMFYGCSKLATMDVSKWDTSGVTDMNSMFEHCWSLTALDVSNWNTGSVTDMSSMFSYCTSLTTLDLSGWNTGSVTNMYGMFYYCSDLTTLDVSNWNTSSVTNMYAMFADCGSLTTLDVSDWNTSSVTYMGGMFADCGSLTAIYIGDGWNTNQVTSSDRMFTGCSNLPNFNSSVVDATHANGNADGYMILLNPALKYLANSSFVLSGTSDYGNSVNMVATSNKRGKLSFKNLEKGTYTLTEVSPTDGYIKNSVKYTVTVTDSGVSVVSDNPSFYYETADQKVLFNEPYHTFTIQKTSSVDSTVGVKGAEFLLSGVSDYGTEVNQPQTTGDTGIATFDHLEAGSYLLTETKAPEHFALDPISRIVTINKYGVVKIDGLSKEGSAFVWTDIRNADGTVTITKNWKDTLTGTDAANRALPSIVISDQRTIPDAVTITYHAGDGHFGTDQTNKTNFVTYTENVNGNGNILSASVSKGQELIPSMASQPFDAWYLDPALTNKVQGTIADYIKANPGKNAIELYANYKTMLTTGQEFNAAIKTLAAGTDKEKWDEDTLIQSIQIAKAPPSGGVTTKDVSASHDGSYLVWWDAGTSTIYLYSKSGDIVLNPDSSYMFNLCESLPTLDVSNWNTGSVTNMRFMFNDCPSLTSLDVSKWDTSRVTDMSKMFGFGAIGGNSLTTLDVSNWNTSNVTDMSGMFAGSGLTTLDASNWDTSNVTGMGSMFYGCINLTTLDVSNWDTSQVTSMSYMFSGCSNLAHIYIGSGWNTSNVTESTYMFSYCTKLPNFNSDVDDKTNAHAGPGGYMERKS